MARRSSEERDETRRALKRAARRLFAERGVDGVAVREIVLAAGQRNSGALHYYFRTKDELVRELVLDGAKLIDDARQKLLDEIESRGGPTTVRDIVYALVLPNFALQGDSGEEDTYLRFIRALQASHLALFREILDERWAQGYQRCLAHLRRLLAPMEPERINQRLVFMGLSMQAILAAREAALDTNGHRPHPFWNAPYTTESIVDAVQALLEGRPSEDAAQP